ncbi:hypothetical protein [Niallia taxi]
MKKFVKVLLATTALALAFGFGFGAANVDKNAADLKIEQPKADPPIGW